jgi:glycosyltransferase involved in cell wall biosynthesis
VDWKARMLAEVPLDLSRVHFTGLLAGPLYRRLLRRSTVHVYLTVPFVLSWSMLEAMASGCLLVASDCAPVRDFAEDGRTALLVPHADIAALAARIGLALAQAETLAPLRTAARAAIMAEHAAAVVFPRKRALLEALVAGNAMST